MATQVVNWTTWIQGQLVTHQDLVCHLSGDVHGHPKDMVQFSIGWKGQVLSSDSTPIPVQFGIRM